MFHIKANMDNFISVHILCTAVNMVNWTFVKFQFRSYIPIPIQKGRRILLGVESLSLSLSILQNCNFIYLCQRHKYLLLVCSQLIQCVYILLKLSLLVHLQWNPFFLYFESFFTFSTSSYVHKFFFFIRRSKQLL